MSEQEPQYECPVCVGVTMTKVPPSSDISVVLDYCGRCGGMLFDSGEAQALSKSRPKSLNAEAYRMSCHSCSASMERNADRCPACNWHNVIHCPVCGDDLKPTKQQGLKLDVCSSCKGVWVDNTELAVLWNRSVASVNEGKQHRAKSQDHFVLDALLYDLDSPGDQMAGAAVEGGAQLSAAAVAGAPEAAGSVVEGTGEAAGAIVAGAGEAAKALVEGTGALAGGLFGAIGDTIGNIDFSDVDLA